MSIQQPSSTILTLKTGVFADAQTVANALEHCTGITGGATIDLTGNNLNDADWDHILGRILSATKVITL